MKEIIKTIERAKGNKHIADELELAQNPQFKAYTCHLLFLLAKYIRNE